MQVLRTASLGSNFTGSYKKRVYLLFYFALLFCTYIHNLIINDTVLFFLYIKKLDLYSYAALRKKKYNFLAR